MSEREHIYSPCVRICTLDENDVCRGCLRTLEEIGAWLRASRAEKLAILAAVDARARDAGESAAAAG
ncbi:MAG: DUF1289 domain-containing protein [Pseudomonadales bacterium]